MELNTALLQPCRALKSKKGAEKVQDMGVEQVLARAWKICRRIAVCGAGAALLCAVGTVAAVGRPITAEAAEIQAGVYQAAHLPSPTLEVGSGTVLLDSRPVDVVYYNQADPQYVNAPYGTDTIGPYGCGPTAMAIVVSSLTGQMVDPIQMAEWAYEQGYWYKGRGSLHTLIPDAAKAWGLEVSGCTVDEGDRLRAALSQQKLVVAIMGEGHFTDTGHFIVLRGLDEDGKVLVADPASRERSAQAWGLALILEEAREKSGEAGGPFWIIGEKVP